MNDNSLEPWGLSDTWIYSTMLWLTLHLDPLLGAVKVAEGQYINNKIVLQIKQTNKQANIINKQKVRELTRCYLMQTILLFTTNSI